MSKTSGPSSVGNFVWILPPMVILSLFSNARFTALHHPPYPEPTQFASYLPPTIHLQSNIINTDFL